jgi:alcohol dehydrogenase
VKALRINPRELAETGSWSVSLDSGRLEFGEGALDRLGGLVRELDCKKVLLVTDAGIRAAGHVDRAEGALAAESIDHAVFDEVVENPTTRVVESTREFAQAFGPDCIVALGGGSSMDCAKGVNFLLTNGGKMEDYWGTGKAIEPMLPSVGIPTTAGTGSEAQSYALISQEGSRVKMACGDPKARFRSVILDPSLLPSAPREVRAVAAMDAVSHAVESYVSTRRTPESQRFAREAWRLLESSLETALRSPQQVETWGRMLLGAHFAGWAIEHSMLGAAHACANPLTARFGMTHGVAVGLMLPHVVSFNRVEVDALYAELEDTEPRRDGAPGIEQRIRELRQACGLGGKLRDYDIPRECFEELAEQASGQWTATFNPRPVGPVELRELYESAY